MRKLFLNIIDLSPQNISDLVWMVALAVWAGVWIVLIADILKSSKSGFSKFVWLFFTSIPVAGGVLYSFSELVFSDWKAAFSWRHHEMKGKPTRAGSRISKN